MIDPATDWIEIHSVPEAKADLVANQVELAWLPRYPLHYNIMIDRGKELLANFKTMMANENGIPCTSISVKNSQVIESCSKTLFPICSSYDNMDIVSAPD